MTMTGLSNFGKIIPKTTSAWTLRAEISRHLKIWMIKNGNPYDSIEGHLEICIGRISNKSNFMNE